MAPPRAQRVLRTTLDALAIDAIAAGVRSPAVIVVGEVAARNDAPAAGAAPLAGVRVLVARTRPRPGLLARRLRQLGADAVETVVARPAPLDDAGAALLAALPGAAGLVLADPDEVAAVVALLRRAGTDVRALAGLTLVAARPDVTAALDALGLAATTLDDLAAGAGDAGRAARAARAEGAVGAGAAVGAGQGTAGRRPAPVPEVLVVGAADLPADGPWTPRRVPLLTDVTADPDPRIADELRHGDFDVAAFASSTAARSTAELYGPLPPDLLVAAMGRRSAQACEAAGIRVDIVPAEPGVRPLAAAVADFVAASRAAAAF